MRLNLGFETLKTTDRFSIKADKIVNQKTFFADTYLPAMTKLLWSQSMLLLIQTVLSLPQDDRMVRDNQRTHYE